MKPQTQNPSQNQPLVQQNTPFRSAYTGHVSVGLSIPEGENMTKQSFKDECDINLIMARYQETGFLPDNLNPAQPQYIDATGFDFDLAMNLVAEATSSFNLLPVEVRNEFNHDPGAFLDFVADPANGPRLREMGLVSDPPEWAKGAAAPMPSQSNGGAATAPQTQNPVTTGDGGEP